MSKVQTLPARSDVQAKDTWDLSSLFPDQASWEEAFLVWQQQIEKFDAYRGTLADSAQAIADCLEFDSEVDRLGERLGTCAFLKTTEDQTDSDCQANLARFQNVATRAQELSSFLRPELLAIDSAKLDEFLATEELKPYRLLLERLLRYKKHTLSNPEERLLAMQGEMSQGASRAFRQLHDADLKFGVIEDENGETVELGNSTFMQFLNSPNRDVRRAAFVQYYEQFEGHKNTLAATLNGSIQVDVYNARARNYDSALEAALFADNVPTTVYDNLISSVRDRLSAVHHYYDVRRRKMKLETIHHYDTYVPILSELESKRTWEQAVALVLDSLAPLGTEYCDALGKGLEGRWCDRYPNRGKQSGAFSCGSFDGDPYILMNYKPKVLDDVFTLAHEAGHSMHTYYSAKSQPYLYYDYTIFVAEVASTFNEQLLSVKMMEQAGDDKTRAYLINRELDGIRGTLVRQTMFAEFEKITHAMAEHGEPLTVQSFQDVYRELLAAYFGPDFTLDEELALECFRIPHFYRAFYVYKYATGISAAIALSERVLSGGQQELDEYLGFLQGGCSKYPLDLLRDAGVDMEQPQAVDTALARFDRLVNELDSLI